MCYIPLLRKVTFDFMIVFVWLLNIVHAFTKFLKIFIIWLFWDKFKTNNQWREINISKIWLEGKNLYFLKEWVFLWKNMLSVTTDKRKVFIFLISKLSMPCLSFVYSYQCLSPPTLRVENPLRQGVLDTTLSLG